MDNYWVTTFLPSIISFIIIYIWSKKWNGKPILPETFNRNRQARSAIIVLISTFILIFIFTAIFSQGIRKDDLHSYGFEDVFVQAIIFLILLIPMFVVLARDRLKLSDLQYRKSNLILSLFLGILIGLIFLILSGRILQILKLSKSSLLFAGLQYLVVGFAEETLFRGYVQVRFIAQWGFWKGFISTSVIFCLWHFPTYSLGMNMSFSAASIEVIKVLPLSLLLGYSLEKTGNIITPVMIHLFINWVQI